MLLFAHSTDETARSRPLSSANKIVCFLERMCKQEAGLQDQKRQAVPCCQAILAGQGAENAAVCSAGGDKDGGVLVLLASMIEAAHTFVQRAAQLTVQEGAMGPVSLPAAVYPPFQSQFDRCASFGS